MTTADTRLKESAKTNALRRFMIRLSGGVTPEEYFKGKHRAYASGFDDGADEPPMTLDGKPLGRGYRRMRTRKRDLTDVSQDRAIEASYRIWNTNPLGKAIIEIIMDYVLGEGPELIAQNDEVGEVIDGFWKDPVNKLEDELAESLTRELSIFGELIVLAFVQTGEDVGAVLSGRVRLGTIDPSQIEHIITSKDNPRDIVAIELKKSPEDDKAKLYKVIRQGSNGEILEGVQDLKKYADLTKRLNASEKDEEVKRISEAEFKEELPKTRHKLTGGRRWGYDPIKITPDQRSAWRVREADKGEIKEDTEFDGQCFFFQVNKLSTGLRGRPDILPSIDWLDRFDQLFFDGSEHVQLINQLVYDLEIEGGSSTSDDPDLNLKNQAELVASIPPGGVYAHSGAVTLKASTPDLKTPDLAVIIRSLRVFITGGNRIPEHWVAEGGTVTRTTAREMGQPTYRMLIRRQSFVHNIFFEMCQFAIDVAVALGKLDEMVKVKDTDGKDLAELVPAREAFEINMPDINVEDTARAAEALASIAQAVLPLVTSGTLPMKPALELIAAVTELLGVKIDVESVMDEATQPPDGADSDKAMAELVKDLMSKIKALSDEPDLNEDLIEEPLAA